MLPHHWDFRLRVYFDTKMPATLVDVPAAGGQDLLHGGLCAEDDAVLHLHEPPPSHRFHPLRLEQLSKRHPARLGPWASRLAARWLHPVPEMRHDGSEVRRVPIT